MLKKLFIVLFFFFLGSGLFASTTNEAGWFSWGTGFDGTNYNYFWVTSDQTFKCNVNDNGGTGIQLFLRKKKDPELYSFLVQASTRLCDFKWGGSGKYRMAFNYDSVSFEIVAMRLGND